MQLHATDDARGSDPDPEAGSTPAIVARGLTKRFGDRLAVDDLSFDVPWGRVTGFLGPNGAGKTTTLRMILGLARPTAGMATILGQRYGDLVNPSHAVGAALEVSAFHPRRTARNHLRVLAAAGRILDQRVGEVLRDVDLEKDARRKVGTFSLGMRQRLSLAGALLGEPEVLVLDEPANGLDPAGMRWLRQFLRSFAGRGNAVFVSSHLLAEMEQMADEVVVINRGRLVVHAPIEKLVSATSRGVRVRTPEPDRLRDALTSEGVDASASGPDQLAVRGATAEQVGTIAARAGVVIFGLDSETESLEEVFLELTNPKG